MDNFEIWFDCPKCERKVRVKKDGTLPIHNIVGRRNQMGHIPPLQCPLSGKEWGMWPGLLRVEFFYYKKETRSRRRENQQKESSCDRQEP